MKNTCRSFLLIIVIVLAIRVMDDNFKATSSERVFKTHQDSVVVKNQKKTDILLTLVNSTHSIPDGWSVDEVTIGNGLTVDKRIYADLMSMLQDAKEDGYDLLVCSAYRSEAKQTQLYQTKVKEYLKQGFLQSKAEEKAAYWVAKPGTSEHQLGLAVDIVSKKNQRLDDSQEETAEQQWLMENCWKYGFILRYPPAKSEITKVGYEPWHYRYVGKTFAQEINAQGVCLEEYLNLA